MRINDLTRTGGRAALVPCPIGRIALVAQPMSDATHTLADRVGELLHAVKANAGQDFAGTGILVTATPDLLPIVPLRPTINFGTALPVERVLADISHIDNEFHDGFHILSPQLDLILLSQYFSPPVVPGLAADPGRRLGGRYMAALFGSCLDGVLAAGVASTAYGVVVFECGREIALLT